MTYCMWDNVGPPIFPKDGVVADIGKHAIVERDNDEKDSVGVIREGDDDHPLGTRNSVSRHDGG